MFTCPFCSKEVRADDVGTPNALSEVHGYVARRSTGGVNAVRLSEPTGRHAHRWCIEKEAKNVSARQGSLL